MLRIGGEEKLSDFNRKMIAHNSVHLYSQITFEFMLRRGHCIKNANFFMENVYIGKQMFGGGDQAWLTRKGLKDEMRRFVNYKMRTLHEMSTWAAVGERAVDELIAETMENFSLEISRGSLQCPAWVNEKDDGVFPFLKLEYLHNTMLVLIGGSLCAWFLFLLEFIYVSVYKCFLKRKRALRPFSICHHVRQRFNLSTRVRILNHNSNY